MKLSEAIRNGAKLSTQGFGMLAHENRTCALGAAAEWLQFCGITRDFNYIEHFPLLRSTQAPPCHCEHIDVNALGFGAMDEGNQLMVLIAHLNDDHRWSREAIAEWVETVENKIEGDKREDAKGVTNSPPACAHEDKEVYPVEVATS